jgi:hypothetical protein
MTDAKNTAGEGDQMLRLSRALRDANAKAEKAERKAKTLADKLAAAQNQLANAKAAAAHAHRTAGQICGRSVPELDGGFQLRFDRDFTAGSTLYAKGMTVGVYLPTMELPLDFVADGLRKGLIRATVIQPLKPAEPKDETGATGEGENTGKPE